LKKILYISAFEHFRMGGQKSMLALIENLDRNAFCPCVALPKVGELSNKLDEINVEWFLYQTPPLKPKNLVAVVKSILRLKNLVKDNNIDLIHPDFERDALLAGIVGKITSTPVVWHVRLTRRTKQDKLIKKLATKVICISEGAKVRFFPFDNDEKYEVVFNGVDTELFKPIADKVEKKVSLNLPKEKQIIGFVGQLKVGKGIFDLLEGFKIFSDKNEANFLLLIGEFDNATTKSKFYDLIDNFNLRDKLRIESQKTDIHNWMAIMDTLILPSHSGVEGMGRVLFEAMACGVPVVGTNVAGVREAFDDNSGISVTEKSPTEIANSFFALFDDDKKRLEMGAEARKQALEKFDIKIHAKNVMKLYGEI